jgi:putative FmdB family regulatory protein
MSARAGGIRRRKPRTFSRSASSGWTPCCAATLRRSSIDGSAGLDSVAIPIYEYRCGDCEERFEEFLTSSTKPAPPCPKCGSENVTRLMSRISTEWMPSDVDWDRVGRKWD